MTGQTRILSQARINEVKKLGVYLGNMKIVHRSVDKESARKHKFMYKMPQGQNALLGRRNLDPMIGLKIDESVRELSRIKASQISVSDDDIV